jgi:Ca2+:H+ antiporter
MRSHHSLYSGIFDTDSELVEEEREQLTVAESIVAVLLGLTCVSFMAIFLVDEIPYIVEKRHIKDA